MNPRLPGRCIVCARPVAWYRRAWREPVATAHHTGRAHACPEARAVCGAFMPKARERCARRPGHTTEHRTSYAVENARRKGAVAA